MDIGNLEISDPVAGRKTRIIRRSEVSERTGLAPSTIYWRLKNDPEFPRPIKIGANSIGWLESEIDDFIERLIQQARG